MANLQGKDSILFIHDGTAYLPIGCLTDNGISISRELREGTVTKCDPNPEGVPQTATYEATFSAVSEDDEISKFTYKKLKAQIYTNEKTYWKTQVNGVDDEFGAGYLTSLNKSNPVDGDVTFEGTLQGVGVVSDTDLYTTTTTTTTTI